MRLYMYFVPMQYGDVTFFDHESYFSNSVSVVNCHNIFITYY